MHQSLNILRKDAKQLWRQLMMPCSALLILTLIDSRAWPETTTPHILRVAMLSRVLALLFCMTWAVLLVSLVHQERLVGMNQFWTTRPYEWRKLVMAKILFVIGFCYVPLACAQVLLLLCWGLPVMQNVPALIHNLVLFTAVIVLPVGCAAALTRSTVQVMWSFLGFFAALALLAASARFTDRLTPHYLISIQICIVVSFLVAALVNQYRTRVTSRSVYILIPMPLLVIGLQLLIPGSSSAAYEFSHGASPLSIRISPAAPEATTDARSKSSSDGLRLIKLPLLISRSSDENTFLIAGHRLVLSAAEGVSWQSPWLSVSGMLGATFQHMEETGSVEFAIPGEVLEKLRNKPVTTRVEFAAIELERLPVQRAQVTTAGSVIQNLGHCGVDWTYSSISCRSAFRPPPLFEVETSRHFPCDGSQRSQAKAMGSIGEVDWIWMLPAIDPLENTPIKLNLPKQPGYLCPGTPIVFSGTISGPRLRIRTPPAQLNLADYLAD